MVAIDGAPTTAPHSRTEDSAPPLPAAWADLSSEFFVEWQVADHWAHATTYNGEK